MTTGEVIMMVGVQFRAGARVEVDNESRVMGNFCLKSWGRVVRKMGKARTES